MKKCQKKNKNIFFISSQDFVFKTVKQQSGLLVSPRAKIRKREFIMACSPLEQFAIIPLIPIHIGNLYLSFTCGARAHYSMV
jgi:hypothetical protein